jgi:hypothetical protein
MMTAENFEYEPPMRKIATLCKNVFALVAGDITAHSEAIQMLRTHIAVNAECRVHDIAELYGVCLCEISAKRARKEFVIPYNLIINDIGTQQATKDALAIKLQQDVSTYCLDVEAIITGHDTGAHIYVLDYRGQTYCQDDIGFAAIGAGYQHAKSQFMISGYANYWKFFDVATLTHWAKKSAEAAVGVGSHTDMHIVGKYGLDHLKEPLVKRMDAEYLRYRRKRKAVFDAAVQSNFKAFLKSNRPIESEARAEGSPDSVPVAPSLVTDSGRDVRKTSPYVIEDGDHTERASPGLSDSQRS